MSQYRHNDPVEEARLLLPWYITGKLSEVEKKLVENTLVQHPELEEEYQRELNMVDAIRANTGLLELSAMDTTQYRLEKLLKRIERAEESDSKAVSTVTTSPSASVGSLWRWDIKSWLQNCLPTFEWLMPRHAAFAMLLLIQLGFVGWFANSIMTKPTESVYTTAAVADDQPSLSVAKGLVLLVDFNDETQMSKIQAFLSDWNATIIDGPDENNLFKIYIKGVQPTDQQQADVILQKMGQDAAVIAFIGREF
ncbi:hypothetical protein [Thiothrix lacustris]|uniref:hypothetical protein n=1 Tax=Thiothrix lacustris TaxID=525917 RepID=UPI00048AED62|nr:hypothetical protein [Thiothrix lacustris]